jgi:hypothetical protein
VDYVPVVESKTMDTSADTVIAHTPTITSTTALSVWRRELMSRQLEIYEVEYSCSPGGIDKWEIVEVGGDYLRGDFDNADEAISYALMEFEGQELNLNVKSLKWYHANQEREGANV